MTTLVLVILIVLGAAGFAFSYSVGIHKQRGQKMVCYVGNDCDEVVNSEYSSFLGLPLEFLGMTYYAFIIASNLLFLAFPAATAPLMIWVVIFSAAAFLFSAYLIFIQGFVLREWCEWCILSALTSTVIFVVEVLGVPMPIVEFLRVNVSSVFVVFSLSTAVGVGAGIITNVLLFKFLRDLQISANESSILKAVAQVVWLALAGIVLSTVALYLVNQGPLADLSRLIVYSVMVLLLIVTEALLNLWISPRMIRAAYGRMHKHTPGELRRARQYAFAMGAVSIVSWFGLFIIESFAEQDYSLILFLPIFLLVLLVVIVLSQFADRAIASDKV